MRGRSLTEREPRTGPDPCWLLLPALGVALACGASTAPGTVDLFEPLSTAVYLEYDRLSRLDHPRRRGDLLVADTWSALPVTPGSGWLRPSRIGWLPIGARADLEVRHWGDAPVERPTLRLDLYRVPDAEGTQRLRVQVNGTPVGEAELAHGPNELFFSVPPEVVGRPATAELIFEPSLRREGPGRAPVNLFGLALGDEERVRRPPAPAPPPPHDPDERLLRFVGSGLLVAPLDVPPGSRGLDFQLRCPEGAARIRLSVLDRAGNERVAEELGECSSSWRTARVSLASLTGRAHTLALEVLGGSTEPRLELRRPQLVGASPTADPVETDGDAKARSKGAPRVAAGADGQPHGEGSARERRPDILLIILDAARADHFGSAGYERDTTPNMDRLAAESLVFERAYSECPNTFCSIPNLISGVSFMDLGTALHGKRIPDEVTTLAEHVLPLGYRTVGLTANPNNSASRNSHQGFDHFERLWGAHRQAELAARLIEETPDDQPLYLQLHLLPPHEPYNPREAFDIFTDPGYRGPVHPEMGLRRYKRGLATFSPTDLEQLIALYDGNLRMADDAVEEVLQAMKRHRRWDEALVLVTSDHGEAFGEHGTFQHSSTVFDEMLHVPFILRLPGGEIPAAVDTSRPVALADGVPTLLGYLGLEPPPEAWGIDLLAAPTPATEERYLYHRTSHRKRPLLAIRDARWKAITGRGMRTTMLFDLEADPDERNNLAHVRPDLFSGLALRLRDYVVDRESRGPQTTEDVELSSEEAELLRSLGYVE